ncbi:MAG: phosphoribosylamine--glycine ligase [Ignavibacteriales bacterium]|nr:phosphoribosylamine--glycine ligase [Ignavibacteriales bacterium]
MNVLVVGGGGREHALAWKIVQSENCEKIYIAPGNAGTELVGENVALDVAAHSAVVEFCEKKKIDLVVVGPEAPLVAGLADSLTEAGISTFGPSASAARVESEKSRAKLLMKKYGIPTASAISFKAKDFSAALELLKTHEYPLVLKANGLAAGKGVVICHSFVEASEALRAMMVDRIFGKAGEEVLVEEFMTGQEASVFAVTDGKDYALLPASQDHKRVGEGDTGKNTGGMGAYAPTPVVDEETMARVEKEIIKPTIDGMRKDGTPFVGCLYAGLMLTDQGPKVVEFNCRFGDPETQAVLPLVEGDFLGLLKSAADGKLDNGNVRYSGGASVCVVAAAGGYPDKYEKGKTITGLDDMPDSVVVFHAGTKREGASIVTSGGRVLGATSIVPENDLKAAIAKAYEGIEKISFEKMYYRNDIAAKATR